MLEVTFNSLSEVVNEVGYKIQFQGTQISWGVTKF